MTRLRCLLQLMLLLLATSATTRGDLPDFVGTSHNMKEYIDCGTLKFCMVHASCTTDGGDEGWTIFDTKSYANPDLSKFIPSCGRYITISPLREGKSAEVWIVDSKQSKMKGVKLYFKSTQGMEPHIRCKDNNVVDKDEGFGTFYAFKISSKQLEPTHLSKSFTMCYFTLSTTDDEDIRQKITYALNNKQFKISVDYSDKKEDSIVKEVNLWKIRVPCSDDTILSKIRNLGSVHNVDEKEEQRPFDINLTPENLYYKRNNGDGTKWVNESGKIQCPDGYPMHHRKDASNSESPWVPVKNGLECDAGELHYAGDRSKVVEGDFQIKCARKKCGVCEMPLKMNGIDTAKPLFNGAEHGDQCRTLTCSQMMILKMKNQPSLILYKHPVLTCSAENDLETKFWDVNKEYSPKGQIKDEILEANCTTDVDCRLIHPLNQAPCEDNNCHKVRIAKNYNSSFPCPDEFQLRYAAPNTGNEKNLTNGRFNCDSDTGKWIALDEQMHPFTILDNATLSCVRKGKDAGPRKNDDAAPFVGSVPFYVLIGGFVLLVIAAAIIGGFCIQRYRKEKAAKKKAMASVSVTFKEPPKYKKRSKKSERKRRSAVKSVTGTMSGPDSQSGSVPIAPPSKLLTPSKGIAKPDKGCAIFDLTTGQSKNLKWTNHTGDGPPTSRQPESERIDSNVSEIPSAIKFAPGELEAARRAGEIKAALKKEKSRQNSIEYNLGDPKPLRNDEWMKVKAKLAGSAVESENVDESTTKKRSHDDVCY